MAGPRLLHLRTHRVNSRVMHWYLLMLIFPFMVLDGSGMCALGGAGIQNDVVAVEDVKLVQTKGIADGDAWLAGRQRSQGADAEDFGSSDGGRTTRDGRGDMVLPAPEQGSPDHFAQGRRYGTAAKLQRLEEEGHDESVQMLIKRSWAF